MYTRAAISSAGSLVLGLLSNYVWALEEPGTVLALEQLKGTAPLARFYDSGSGITRVYGQPLALGTSPWQSAEKFKADHARAFGVDPADLVPIGLSGEGAQTQPLMYDRETGRYKFTLVTYHQYREGIPVFRAELRLLVRNDPDFPLVLAASSLRSLGDFIPRPVSKPFDPAAQKAIDMAAFTAPETVIWAGVDDAVSEPREAVTFVGAKGSPEHGDYEKWLFVADAFTGEILYRENLVILTNVNGNVSGMATEIPRPDVCLPEVLTPMPWATARVLSGNSTYTGANGDFTIMNGGTSDVTVQSPMSGHYFVVSDAAGPAETLSQTVTPPGPVYFVHNSANTSEFIRAQVNGYIQANLVRDFALTYNPDYPVVSVQTGFPVRVNRSDMYCPGNAWYDEYSINFCAAAGSYPNTAFSQTVHHEYGHHLVRSAGSGQDQYGEGMSDSVGVLIADDPVQGYGWYGNCNEGMRTADNNYQYPCTGEIHDCGQLLSGCIWSTRNELASTHSDTYLDILSNLTINSILLNSSGLITPQITIDFLTLDDNDGNIGNGTPHRNEICAGFGAHNMNCPQLDTRLSVTPTASLESQGPEGGPFTPGSKIYTVENRSGYPFDYAVTTTSTWLSLTNESGTVGAYGSTPVTVSLNANAAALSAGPHTGEVNFINVSDHTGDTSRQVFVMVGVSTVVYGWSLDTDPGWSTAPGWAWGQPTGGGGQYGGPDPTSGHTGSNVYGYNLNGDYESNMQLGLWLRTPPLDCTNLWNVRLRFWRWLGVGHPTGDWATIELSYDGFVGTAVWRNYEEITDYAWVQQEIDISALADNKPAVYLHWVMGPTDKSRNYCGWNIDDIQILAISGAATCDDGALNQNEDRIDCGGPCPPCECLSDAECADGLFCTGAETCDAYGHCQAGGQPCLGQLCEEVNDLCVDCFNNGDCDDGLFCDGAETCVGGACQAGSDPCPGQNCDEVNNVCTGCNNDGDCDAGENCSTCENDCIGAAGAACGNGICETGNGEDCVSCPADCNGKQSGPLNKQFCCGDGDGRNPVTCSDSRCTTAPFACTSTPVVSYCCGDAACQGAENKCNCAVDCGTPPASEVPNSTCNNGVDDDCDGVKDCTDSNCATDPACVCKPAGATCTTNGECCSNSCRRGKCR